MRRADFKSDAEYYRRHRQVFVLAQELGVTPNEAEAELKRREAHLSWRASKVRLEAKMNAPIARPRADEWSAPWMMRE